MCAANAPDRDGPVCAYGINRPSGVAASDRKRMQEPPGQARCAIQEQSTHMASTALMDRPISDHGMEDFASLLDETLALDAGFEGSVVTGRVIRLTDEYAIVDVGLKSEGRVLLKEFGAPGRRPR